jgi:hypothetical protein
MCEIGAIGRVLRTRGGLSTKRLREPDGTFALLLGDDLLTGFASLLALQRGAGEAGRPAPGGDKRGGQESNHDRQYWSPAMTGA